MSRGGQEEAFLRSATVKYLRGNLAVGQFYEMLTKRAGGMGAEVAVLKVARGIPEDKVSCLIRLVVHASQRWRSRSRSMPIVNRDFFDVPEIEIDLYPSDSRSCIEIEAEIVQYRRFTYGIFAPPPGECIAILPWHTNNAFFREQFYLRTGRRKVGYGQLDVSS